MKRNWKPLIPVCMAGSLLAAQLTGCSQTGDIDETVHLILNGVELSNMATAPIYSKGEGKIILTLADGTKQRF